MIGVPSVLLWVWLGCLIVMETKAQYVKRKMAQGRTKKEAEAYWRQKQRYADNDQTEHNNVSVTVSPLTGELGALERLAKEQPLTANARLRAYCKNRMAAEVRRTAVRRPKDARILGKPVFTQLQGDD